MSQGRKAYIGVRLVLCRVFESPALWRTIAGLEMESVLPLPDDFGASTWTSTLIPAGRGTGSGPEYRRQVGQVRSFLGAGSTLAPITRLGPAGMPE